jgi:hypothetical protein
MTRDTLKKFLRDLRHFAREYRAEIVAAIIALAGIFFLFEQLELKQIIWEALAQLGVSIQAWLIQVGGAFGLFLASLTVSNVLGVLLLAVAAVIVGRRLRWRMLRANKISFEQCPRCGRALSHSHRTFGERVLSRVLFIHIRGYRCTNLECRWRGIRASE